MAKEPKDETQTTPEGAERDALGLPGEGGYEIPVPKRRDVMDALGKVARPTKRPSLREALRKAGRKSGNGHSGTK